VDVRRKEHGYKEVAEKTGLIKLCITRNNHPGRIFEARRGDQWPNGNVRIVVIPLELILCPIDFLPVNRLAPLVM
jgi:hypothetical protein